MICRIKLVQLLLDNNSKDKNQAFHMHQIITNF
jgi:hypothetical protein